MTTTSPSRQRLDLNGTWQLVFDPSEIGIKQGWVSGSFPGAQDITVPGIWNLTQPDAGGVGFYRRVFTVPSGWANQATLLHFEGASYRTQAWLNGHYLGSHEGAYTPFAFELSPFININTENELIVRVVGLSRTREVDGMLLPQMPASKQSWYYAYGGLWGQVHLESVPHLSCETVHVEPDLRGERAHATITLHNRTTSPRPIDLQIIVADPAGVETAALTTRTTAQPGQTQLRYSLPIARPLPWTCDQPHLYQLQVALQDGENHDSQTVPFGMRDFTVKNGQFFLNDAPTFLRCVLLQPNYPVNLITPPTYDMMLREITLVKEAGFNVIRTHLRPAPPGYLDICDQLGLLVYAETSLAWIKDSPRLMEHGQREIAELIQRDRNHPSVVFWGIYNENPSMSAVNSEALLRFTRALDPTRVVVDNSGGSLAIDQDFGWIDRASVVPSHEVERQKIFDIHLYLGGFIPNPVYDWLRRLGTGVSSQVLTGQDFGSTAIMAEFDRELRSYDGHIFVSELGCAGMMDLDQSVAAFGDQMHLLDAREIKIFRDDLHTGFATRGLEEIFGSVQGLVSAAQTLQAAGNNRQIEALLANPRISGYLITQLNDVGYEFHAGLLDLWRNPKQAYHAAKRLNQPHVLILKASHIVALPGDRVEVTLTLVNQHPLQASDPVSIRVTDPTGAVLLTHQHDAASNTGIQELGAIAFEAGQANGQYTITARLPMPDGEIVETTETVEVLSPVDWATVSHDIRWVGTPPVLAQTFAGQGAGAEDASLWVVAAPASVSESQWEAMLASVEIGQTAIIGPLHKRDSMALNLLAQHGLKIQLQFGIGSWLGCYHIIPQSDLFSGLPAGGLAGRPYADVHPWYSMMELGGRVLARGLSNTQTRREPAAMLWMSDVEVVPLGRGRLIFCQYRIMDQAHNHPLAAKMTANLIKIAQLTQP